MIVLLAVDVPLALLTVGVIVLCITTTATVLGLTPSMRRARERPSGQLALPPGSPRRVITGRPVELPDARAHAAPQPAIGSPGAVPAQTTVSAVEAAEATIIRMLDEHPETIARVLASWLDHDDPHRRRP